MIDATLSKMMATVYVFEDVFMPTKLLRIYRFSLYDRRGTGNNDQSLIISHFKKISDASQAPEESTSTNPFWIMLTKACSPSKGFPKHLFFITLTMLSSIVLMGYVSYHFSV